MSKEQERKKSQVFFIASRDSDKRPYVEKGLLMSINVRAQNFIVKVSRNQIEKFEIVDYNDIVFQTYEEAKELVEKQPDVGQKVYYVRKDKRKVTEEVVSGYSIPFIFFECGEKVRVTEAGKTYFKYKWQALSVLIK